MKWMSPENEQRMYDVLAEVAVERHRQHAVHGVQNLPRYPLSPETRQMMELRLRTLRKLEATRGPTWDGVLQEEVTEAQIEFDPAKLRVELLQVAAVAVQWVEAIDREVAQ